MDFALGMIIENELSTASFQLLNNNSSSSSWPPPKKRFSVSFQSKYYKQY